MPKAALDLPSLTTAEVARFWAKVEKTSSCWLWIAGMFTSGYGAFSVSGKARKAHRVAYVLTYGEIPDGLPLDHICRVRACVNPDHLRPVTNKENILLGIGPTAVNARKTECRYGHPYTSGNTYINRKGERECRTCRADRRKAAYRLRHQRKLAARAEATRS